MRELIIEAIKQSSWYKECVKHGFNLPNLDNFTDHALLNCYDFVSNWSPK